MRFLVAVIDDGTNTGTPDEMEKIDAFNQMLRDNGHFVLAWGLEDPARSTVIDNRGATPVITKGPVVTAKEFMAGFWIIDASDACERRFVADITHSRCSSIKDSLKADKRLD